MTALRQRIAFSARLSILLAVVHIAAQPANAKDIQPPDVYQNSMVIRAELDQIREALGMLRNSRPEITVRGAAPREVFFQAITLWVKAERLCKEFRRAGLNHTTRIEVAPPDKVTPGDVYTLTQNVRGRLSCVRRILELDYQIDVPPRDASKTPSDVFRSIVQANRQLNLLLTHPFSPSDVFAIVSLTNEYLRETMDRLSPGWRAGEPKLPPLVQGKQPADVYRQLIRCLAVARRIAAKSNLQMLEFEADIGHTIVPSDVFDIASLVFSEVRYFATRAGIKKRYKIRARIDKVPSDVFQKALWLENLLVTFEDLVQRHPNWHASR